MEQKFTFQDVFNYDEKAIELWNKIHPTDCMGMPIWHYNKAERIVRNIENGKINLGSLKYFDDSHEGDFPDIVRKTDFWNGYERSKVIDEHIRTAPALKANIYIICWTARCEEYEGFWKSFAGIDDGIAIKTTAGKLSAEKDRLRLSRVHSGLKMINVKYAKFEKINAYSDWTELNFLDFHGPGNENPDTLSDGRLAFGNKYFPAHIKRHTFFHEREVRFVALDEKLPQQRLELDFDWTKVIDKIYFSPMMTQQSFDAYKARLSKVISCPMLRSKVYQL